MSRGLGDVYKRQGRGGWSALHWTRTVSPLTPCAQCKALLAGGRSQAMSAAVATRFNKFSKVTSSQLSDHSHEIGKSLLVYLVLSSLYDCLPKSHIPRMLHFSSITYHPFYLYKTLFPHPPKCSLSLLSPHCLVFVCAYAYMKCGISCIDQIMLF